MGNELGNVIELSGGFYRRKRDIEYFARQYFRMYSRLSFDGQIGGQVARQRCLKFDLSTIDASPAIEYPAE